MKLLIVDDSKFIRDVTKRHVVDMDIQLLEAGDAESAIEVYKNERPDIVLLDMMMKKEDSGLHAIKGIRDIDSEARIVVITALGDNDPYVKEAIELGVMDVITKPIKKEELLKYLEPDSAFKTKFE